MIQIKTFSSWFRRTWAAAWKPARTGCLATYIGSVLNERSKTIRYIYIYPLKRTRKSVCVQYIHVVVNNARYRSRSLKSLRLFTTRTWTYYTCLHISASSSIAINVCPHVLSAQTSAKEWIHVFTPFRTLLYVYLSERRVTKINLRVYGVNETSGT
jgi:hypothetical protein